MTTPSLPSSTNGTPPTQVSLSRFGRSLRRRPAKPIYLGETRSTLENLTNSSSSYQTGLATLSASRDSGDFSRPWPRDITLPMKLGGNFFEDLYPGQTLINPVPRTLTEGDTPLYIALTGDRNPKNCSDEFARGLGFERAPVHDMLVFHIVFGRTVGEISLNSPGNLGYADLRFLRPVYTGDTLRATTETLGWRETSKGDTGVVWVRTVGFNQRDEAVLQFYRWVMVNKRDPGTPTHADSAAEMPAAASLDHVAFPSIKTFDASATGGSSVLEGSAA